MVGTHSADAISGTFNTLRHLRHSSSFVAADKDGDEIPATFFGELRDHFGDAAWRMHYIRHWYRSCADYGCEAFSPEVAFELEEKKIPNNRRGQAVLSLDPEGGPLNDLEITGLLNALRAARSDKSRSRDEQAALWLCVALGSNPMQLALLREEDIAVLDQDGRSFVQVKVPRMKKRHQAPRTDFKTRKLTPEIGQIVLELIEQNRRRRDVDGWPNEAYGKPVFVRSSPRPGEVEGPLVEYAMHLYASEFTDLVERAVASLKVISPRTKLPLHVTCRRLRYTFATRLVREGASMREVAQALDHSDLQSVRVYFDIKSDVVESLDRAMALALGPVAQAFLGKIVGSEATAERGGDPRSRIMVLEKDTGEAKGLGTCGQHSFCGLFAPVACYTCRQFQPWIDGPHDRILEDLLARRDRKLTAGQDGRMVAIHDATILAIGDVIARIEAMRRQSEVP
jgi:integrase